MRDWQGPAILSLGFRPFFLFGALHAALMVALWVPWFLGIIHIPSAFPPVAWHKHELLFGFVPAIIAGFLLTAIPNWTGRLPVVGWPLFGLFALWLVGRISVAFSQMLPELAVALAALLFPLAFISVIAREIITGKNWRNLKVLVVFSLLTISLALFHYEIGRFGTSVFSDRLAIATIIMLITIIGGRIIPSFTINWLKRKNPGALPVPFNTFDKWVMGITGLALLVWVGLPALGAYAAPVGGLLLLVALVHFVRLARWRSHRTLREPLVLILHAAYAFVPLGFGLAGYAALVGDHGAEMASIHTWTVGAIGTMTLAVMTRATRGHSGKPLTATFGTTIIFIAILIAAFARISAALWPTYSTFLMPVAGLGWIFAFAGFAAAYAPMLLSKRQPAKF